ncbi:hypothetical protein NUH86_16065 [Sphingobium sp. JS3065]|uniref:hypothetical protein n=1 Tax=Sphingobium sp. JS3065 TaxID=2970925 RepID=UPI0022644CB9|nr:hypothetical protein [Sphingobium sp. JS3065]UZW54970.1 hypothetical protein NUH86_16065 [Sphingobium sp. JS3065]
MIQIAIWLLCAYLVFKGKELQFIAASSTHESRDENLKSAKTWARAAYAVAVIFFILSIAQGNSFPTPPSNF